MSSSLSNAKTLGGIGSILVLLTAAPSIGWVLGIAGFVMILVAVKYISDDLNEKGIFNNMISAVVSAVAGILVASLVVATTVFSAFANGYFTSNFTPSASVTTAQWITFGTAIGLGLFAAWIFFLVSAIFLRRSYNAIGTKLNANMFGTAGLLYLIGAATAIIGVGFLLLLVAEVLTAVAFFSLPERTPEVTQPHIVTIAH
jgi:uncharacterized membrane protein